MPSPIRKVWSRDARIKRTLAVVAEGVERDEQCEHLRQLGCDAVQGYLISRPMPAAEVSQWMSRAEAPHDIADDER
ncbi:EAL domain-containing protein [Trinickia sp. EG282A]|uniref:EAL domain-containing protein n=1 Tax=Trinickia sp. EG282A TaxID=3237013 RepID=UPI0034D16B53